MLLNILLYAKGTNSGQNYITDNADAECGYYPADKMLVVLNNSQDEVHTAVKTENGKKNFILKPYETQITHI